MESAPDINEVSAEQLRSSVGLLALLALPRVGPRTALRAAIAAIRTGSAPALRPPGRPQLEAAGEQLERYTAAGVHLVSFFDEQYPPRLRLIHQPPPLLFVRGSLDAVSETRLAQAAWVVVSGLANGIDTLAHGAALKHHTRCAQKNCSPFVPRRACRGCPDDLETTDLQVILRGERWGSNPRPPGPQPGALPTELRPPWVCDWQV